MHSTRYHLYLKMSQLNYIALIIFFYNDLLLCTLVEWVFLMTNVFKFDMHVRLLLHVFFVSGTMFIY